MPLEVDWLKTKIQSLSKIKEKIGILLTNEGALSNKIIQDPVQGGFTCSEVAFALLTHESRVRFSAYSC